MFDKFHPWRAGVGATVAALVVIGALSDQNVVCFLHVLPGVLSPLGSELQSIEVRM